MTAKPYTVTVAVLCYNSAEYLPRCLEALKAQSFRDFEVILVDNASTDGSADRLQEEHRHLSLRVERLPMSTGFAAANNLGARMAGGDIYFTSGLAQRRNYNVPHYAPGPPREAFSACAAAALYPRQQFLEAGGFDEDYFLVFRGQGLVILHAKLDALRGLPSMLRKRETVQAERRIEFCEVLRAMNTTPPWAA